MSESPLARAERRTREALKAAPPPAEPAVTAVRAPLQPGDLLVLPRTSGFPVEWAVLERTAAPRRLWLVPADTHPLYGHGDIEVPAGEPGGPLALRCRFAAWTAADWVPAEARRTGRLAPDRVEEAKERCAALARGTLPVSSLADEAEADPEYQDWERQVLEPARFALEEHPAPNRLERRRLVAGHRLWPLLAAACFLGCIGLSLWVGQLHQRLDRPAIRIVSGEVLLDGPSRSGDTPSLSFAVSQPPALTVRIPDQQLAPGAVYLIEVQDAAGRRVQASPAFRRSGDDIVLFLPLPSRLDSCRLRLLRRQGGDWVAEDERVVRFVSPPG